MLTLKKLSLYSLAALALVGCENSKIEKHTPNQTQENTNLDINKISQALGNFIGRNINTPGVNFDLESLIKGIREGAAGKPSPMSDEEYQKSIIELQQQALVAISSKNLEAADKFLKENATAKGIVELVPGKLQYLVLQEGHGATVEEHSAPELTYTGKYLDGTVFGSSDAGGGAISVPLDKTIPGFSKGIVGMKEGEKRRLFVHPELGYGTSGELLPNSLLIFDIEIIKANTSDEVTILDGDMNDQERESTDNQAFDEEEAPQQQTQK